MQCDGYLSYLIWHSVSHYRDTYACRSFWFDSREIKAVLSNPSTGCGGRVCQGLLQWFALFHRNAFNNLLKCPIFSVCEQPLCILGIDVCNVHIIFIFLVFSDCLVTHFSTLLLHILTRTTEVNTCSDSQLLTAYLSYIHYVTWKKMFVLRFSDYYWTEKLKYIGWVTGLAGTWKNIWTSIFEMYFSVTVGTAAAWLWLLWVTMTYCSHVPL